MSEDTDLYADTPESRAAWEQACLEAVRGELAEPETRQDMLVPSGRIPRGVRLEGSYPDTQLVVEYTDARSGEERERGFELWRPDGLFVPSVGRRSEPVFVRDLIYAHIIEP